MLSHVYKYAKYLQETINQHHKISGELETITGRLTFKLFLKVICKSQRKRMDLFTTKNKKLNVLITFSPSVTPDYNILIINLSANHLNRKELNQIKVVLGYSFVDKSGTRL